MSNLAEKIWRGVEHRAVARSRKEAGESPAPSEEVALDVGALVAKEGASLTVRAGRGDVTASRATSCLLEPEVGDRVLLAGPPGELYVLAVLKREPGAASRLTAEGDIELHAPNGKVVVTSQEGIDLASAKEVAVTSGGFRMNTGDGHVVMERLHFLGSVVRAEVSKIRVIAEQCDSFLERTIQRVKRSYRFVEELDQVRASQIDMTAKDSVRVHADNTVLTANDLVKVDGDQVHIG